MNWRQRLDMLPDREWRLLHGGNVLSSTLLFVLFWWTLPQWVLIPYAAFWGAANFNSLLAWLVRRDMRAWEVARAAAPEEMGLSGYLMNGPTNRECVHGHKRRQVGCVSCVLVFDRAAPEERG